MVPSPTLIVATTVFVLASMTETSLERPFAVYTFDHQDLLQYPRTLAHWNHPVR